MKKLLLDSALVCIRCAMNVKKLILFFFVRGGKFLYRVLRFLLKWPLIILYTGYLKFRFRLSRLGIHFKNPLLHVFSSKSLTFIICIILACIVLVAQQEGGKLDADILQPHNILAVYVTAEGVDFVTEEKTNNQQPLQIYNPLTGVKTSPQASERGMEKNIEQLYPGAVAEKPGALIKPNLPTTEEGLPDHTKIRNYTVKENDTISRIAEKFNLKIQTLLSANNLSLNSSLQIGQNLVILPLDGIIYRVQKGDSLSVLAKRFQVDEQEIRAFNNLSPDTYLALGTTLIIPGGTPVARPTIQRQEYERPKTLFSRLRDIFTPSKKHVTPPPNGEEEIVSESSRGFLWPTSARRISQYFSWHHPGVDIAGPTSNKIYAAADGVVTISGWQNGYGLTLLIDHGNGRETRYGHASKLYVSAGDSVQKGDVIAMVGSTGRSTGPHLHFEIHIGGRKVNPLGFIR